MEVEKTCESCEKDFDNTKKLDKQKLYEGYIEFKCPVCKSYIDSLSYPID